MQEKNTTKQKTNEPNTQEKPTQPSESSWEACLHPPVPFSKLGARNLGEPPLSKAGERIERCQKVEEGGKDLNQGSGRLRAVWNPKYQAVDAVGKPGGFPTLGGGSLIGN